MQNTIKPIKKHRRCHRNRKTHNIETIGKDIWDRRKYHIYQNKQYITVQRRRLQTRYSVASQRLTWLAVMQRVEGLMWMNLTRTHKRSLLQPARRTHSNVWGPADGASASGRQSQNSRTKKRPMFGTLVFPLVVVRCVWSALCVCAGRFVARTMGRCEPTVISSWCSTLLWSTVKHWSPGKPSISIPTQRSALSPTRANDGPRNEQVCDILVCVGSEFWDPLLHYWWEEKTAHAQNLQ